MGREGNTYTISEMVRINKGPWEKSISFLRIFRDTTPPIPSIFALIGTSWQFAKRQSALLHVGFWLLFLPFVAHAQFARIARDLPYFTSRSPEAVVLLSFVYLLFFLLITWGSICVLIIGRRLLQGKAGRVRRSFKAVRAQSRPLFLPFLLTSILRGIFTLLWSLLLIIPGIVFFIRTAFFPIIVVSENISYRAALRESQLLVRGQFWNVFFSLLFLGILLFVPADVVAILTDSMAKGAPLPITLAADILSSALGAFAVTLYLIALTELYGYYRYPQKH